MAQQRGSDEKQPTEAMDSAMGASDANSGGGAGAGVPDPDTVERAGESIAKGDVKQDREKLFPDRDKNRANEPRGRQS